ncbi:MAG: alpha/beta hydrolase [Promethearchaeia archaeon]|nr:MAG: alpha/beta hydrolase [Candidatus Lokiarchaeia archaeon]
MKETLLNYRIHGKSPFKVVFLHGGPGAWGEMAPVADFISRNYEIGCVEAFQTKSTLLEQLKEIGEIISHIAEPPVLLIGFSWGAWLAYLAAANSNYKNLIKAIVMIGCGPFSQSYFPELQQIRKSRMTQEEFSFYQEFESNLQSVGSVQEREHIISELGKICEKTDHCDLLPPSERIIFPKVNFPIDRATFFEKALSELQAERKSGKLLEYALSITCPVFILHGDYDPHPVMGVINPLKPFLDQISVKIFTHCGHKPWMEKQAYSAFFEELQYIVESIFQ